MLPGPVAAATCDTSGVEPCPAMASYASSFTTSPELLSLIEGFIANVSLVLGSQSTALQRVIQDYFVQQPRSGTGEFLLQAAIILQQYPNLVQDLEVFLRFAAVEERLHVVTKDSPSKQVELVVITCPAGGQIYELPGAMLQSDWDWAPVMNSDNLRMVLRQELDFTRRIPSASWACALTELLQHEMKYSIDDAAYRALCLQNLRRIIKKFDILPPSFVVHDIVLDEPRRPLFSGGFADVYKGSLKGQHVCLKVLRIFTQTMEMRAKLLKDFCREALLWKQLDHPNVLPFLGVTLELFAPSFCLVSPWMSNGNVMQYLEQNPGFSRINAVRDIAAAMQYLHEHKPPIVHADIRGTNVLVLDNLQCCLADFGLSVIAESSSITGTSTPSRAGSVRWMAPEILSLSTHDAELNQTPQDIYAFACTFLEIYTEKHPFPEYRVDFKAAQEVSEGRRPSRPPDVFSDELWDLVEKCWRQDPGHRPSARDVVSSLQPKSTFQPQIMSISHLLNESQNSFTFTVPNTGAGRIIYSDANFVDRKLDHSSWTLPPLQLPAISNTNHPRTPISDFAAQHRLQSLLLSPPLARTTLQVPTQQLSHLLYFQTLTENYLAMLSQPASDNDMLLPDDATPLSSAGVSSSIEEDNIQGLLDILASVTPYQDWDIIRYLLPYSRVHHLYSSHHGLPHTRIGIAYDDLLIYDAGPPLFS